MIAITKHVNIVKIKKRCRVGSTTMMAKQRGAGRAIFMHKKSIKKGGKGSRLVTLRAFTEFAALLGPGARLFANTEAEAVAVRNIHTTVAQLQLLIEQRI